MRLRLPLLTALAAASLVPGTSAHAQTPPPPAWTCTAVVTGVRAPRVDLGVVETGEVDTVQAAVVCEALGLLTTAPLNYLPLYAGTMTLGVLVDGSFQGCIGGLGDEANGVWVPSVGPTLVMAAVAVCPPASSDDTATRVPVAYWSTHDLDNASGHYTVAGQAGTFIP